MIPDIIHHKDNPNEFDRWLYKITDESLEDYFIFSVVRNPWDRLVSMATYFDINININDFLSNVGEYLKEDKVKIHSLPLHLYTHMNGRSFLDMTCRFENLQADMDLVFDKINLPRQKLPFVNRSKRSHYAAYYSEAEKNLVGEIYKDDIEYFGYEFEHIGV